VIAADEQRGVFLYEVDGPLRALSRVTGLHPNDTWSGPEVTYRRLDCAGGTLTVGLRSDPNLYQEPSTVRAAGRTTSIPPDSDTHPFTVPLEPVNGVCSVTFSVSPAVVPGHGDLRRLGLHFETFRYHP
jgi:hypothetical protein